MYFINLFIVLSQLLGLCLSAGVVEVNLVSFYNNEGRRRDGQCCDPADSIWSWSWGWFAQKSDETCDVCNHVLSLCVGNETESSSMLSCEYGRKTTNQINQNQITFGRNIGGLNNPLKFSFDTWPGLVKLKLDILDEDDPGSFDFIDHVDYQYSSKDIKRHTEASVKKLHLVGSTTEINLELRVYCEPYFFGFDCSEHCQARDDDRGHYICNPLTGDKICQFGWIGPDCQTNFDDCTGHRCHDGATCIDQIGYYTCKCPPGRTGVYCDGEINECASSPCQNDGICKDHLNGFSCECLADWTGVLCEIQHIECASDLCVHGFCTAKDGQDGCYCKAGYHGELCDMAVKSCTDKPCLHMTQCEDLPAGYRCTCLPGYTGKNCDTRISVCDADPCQNNGRCLDLVDSYVCSCPEGFYGDLCELKTNECESSPCQHGGLCIDLHLDYRCLCTEATTGSNCEQYVDKCYLKPCQNGGTCISEKDGYKCVCPPNTDSPNCEIFITTDPCSSNPCQNEATCLTTVGASFVCQCTPDYTGILCDFFADVCDTLVCQNGGTCHSDTHGCECEEGYTGTFCEEDINECQDDLCENGGTCVDKIGDFECLCSEGFTGLLCDEVESSTPAEDPQTGMTSPSLQIQTGETSSGELMNEEDFSTTTLLGLSLFALEEKLMTTVLDRQTQDNMSISDESMSSDLNFVTDAGRDVLGPNEEILTRENEEVNQDNTTYSSGEESTSGEESLTSTVESGEITTSSEEIINIGDMTTAIQQEITNVTKEITTLDEKDNIEKDVSNTSIEESAKEDTMSGEGTFTMDENTAISGEDAITLAEEETTSGEDAVASGEGVTTSGEDVMASSEGVTTSGEDAMASGEGVTTSGEDVMASSEGVTTSGEDVMASGEGGTTSGEDVITAVKDLITGNETTVSNEEDSTSGEEIATSGEDKSTLDTEATGVDVDVVTLGKDTVTHATDTLTFGDDIVTSGEEAVTPEKHSLTPGDDFVTSGEEEITPKKDSLISGDDNITSGDEGVTSGEDSVTSGEDSVTPGNYVVTSGDDDVTSGEHIFTSSDFLTSSGDVVSADEDVIQPSDYTDTSGEDRVTSGEDRVTSGDGFVTYGEYSERTGTDIDILGYETVTSGDGTTTSGVETVSSGDQAAKSSVGTVISDGNIVTSGDGKDISGEGIVTSGDGKAISGEDIDISGDKIVTSGEEMVTSGQETVLSGEDIVTSGEEIFSAGKHTTLSNKELFSPGEEPSTNRTTDERESSELEVETSPAYEMLNSSEETLGTDRPRYEEITFSFIKVTRNEASWQNKTTDEGITEAVVSGQEVVTSGEKPSKMVSREEEGKYGTASQGTTDGGEKIIVNEDVTPDGTEIETQTTKGVSRAEVKDVIKDSVQTTSRDGTKQFIWSTTLSSGELGQVTKRMITPVPTEQETATDLSKCVEEKLDFSSLSHGIISILSKIKNLLSRESCKTPDTLYSTTISPEVISTDRTTEINVSSTSDRQDRERYGDRLDPASTDATSAASTHQETTGTMSVVPLLLTSNGVHLKDIDQVTAASAVDKIIKASTTRTIVSKKPKPRGTEKSVSSSTKSTTEYTSSYPLHPLQFVTHRVEIATLSLDTGKLTQIPGGFKETEQTTREFQQASKSGAVDQMASLAAETLSTSSVVKDELAKFSTGTIAQVTEIPTQHASKTTSSRRQIPEIIKDVTEKPGPLSTTLETLVILLYDTLPTAVSEDQTGSPGSPKTETSHKATGTTQKSSPGKVTPRGQDTSSDKAESTRISASPLLHDDGKVKQVTTPKHFILGVTENGIQLWNREFTIASAEGTTHRDENMYRYKSTKPATVTDNRNYVDVIIEKETTTSSFQKTLKYSEVAITTRPFQFPTYNAARITRAPLRKKPKVFRGMQGRKFHISQFTTRTNPPTTPPSVTEANAGADRKDSLSGDIGITLYRKGYYITDQPRLGGNRSYPRKDSGGGLVIHSQGGVRPETGRENTATLTVYTAARNVLRIGNETTVQTYSRARQMLRKSLEQLASLWRNSVQGLVEVVYVPSIRRYVDYGSHLNVAYKNIKRAYEYGSNVLHKTYYAASRQITSYYTNLIDYFNTSYSYYYDLFQFSRRK